MSAGISPAPRRRSARLTAAVGAMGLALALAACGSSEPDTVEEAVAEAAGSEVPEALEDVAESLDEVEVPSDVPTPETYEEYKENQAASEDEAEQPGSGGSGDMPAVGDCLDHLPTKAEVDAGAVEVVDCGAEHAADVYAIAEMGRLGVDYPGFDELYAGLNDGCGTAYLDHFGGPVKDTGIVFNFVTPDEQDWANGETDVFCFAMPVGMETYSGELEAEDR